MQTIINAKSIIKKINDHGYEAYLVGGCVRDYLLDIIPNDFDITTNALPDTVESIFVNSIPTGKKYGTISVLVDKELYEVTTYRLESEYTDKRRPEVISYSSSLKEDLMRRDFTINALAMDRDDNIIDYYGGIDDIKNRVIKCVGDANDRFREDNLRKLRAVRFASQKNFNIDADTLKAVQDNPTLEGVSMERIQSEFSKILLSKKPSVGIKLLLETNMLGEIVPELLACVGFEQNNIYHIYDIFDHLCEATDHIDAEIELRLAALLHDIGKVAVYTVDENDIGHFIGHENVSSEITSNILSRMKYSNYTKSKVHDLILFHMKRPLLNEKSIRRFMCKVGVKNINHLIKLYRADLFSSNPALHLDALKYLDELDKMIKIIISKGEPLSRRDLVINGRDIIDLYESQNVSGNNIGLILEYLLSIVIDDPSANNKKRLIKEIEIYIEALDKD